MIAPFRGVLDSNPRGERRTTMTVTPIPAGAASNIWVVDKLTFKTPPMVKFAHTCIVQSAWRVRASVVVAVTSVGVLRA